MVDGVLYITEPNTVLAIDARTGREIWKYTWKGLPAFALGNRGAAIYGDWLFFETYDNHLVSLDIKTGKERWNKEMADVKRDYFSSVSPLVIKNHVIVGVGGDFLDVPNFAEARDPETGEVQWHFWTTAHEGDPGFKTWPNKNAVEHGGGGVWYPSTYDPELNLLYIPTGNANPVMAGQSREGDNLYTASVVALNPDTGKMVWYFQYSPHDTHDWDAAQTPILFDGVIDGKPRKLAGAGASLGAVLRPRPDQRKEHPDGSFHGRAELVQGHRPQRPADPRSDEGAAGRRRAYLAEFQWLDRMAESRLQSGYRTVLRGNLAVVHDLLQDRHRRAAGRLLGHGARRRSGQERTARDRRQDGQNRLEARHQYRRAELCSPRRAIWCSAAMVPGTSSRSMRETASRFGMPVCSRIPATRPSLTCWTGISTFSWRAGKTFTHFVSSRVRNRTGR